MKVLIVLLKTKWLLTRFKTDLENPHEKIQNLIIISLKNAKKYIKKCFNFIGTLKNSAMDAIHPVSKLPFYFPFWSVSTLLFIPTRKQLYLKIWFNFFQKFKYLINKLNQLWRFINNFKIDYRRWFDSGSILVLHKHNFLSP